MTQLTPPKKKIGDVKAFTLLSVAFICDAFKVLLFFFNVVPVVGTALDAAVSFFISIIELLIDFGALGWSGAFSGQGSMVNLLATLAVSAIDLTPVIDDLPVTTPMVAFIIWRTRATYKKEYAAYLKAVEEQKRQQDQEYAMRLQIAQQAAQRAAAVRQQAMDQSIAALDDTDAADEDEEEESYDEAA